MSLLLLAGEMHCIHPKETGDSLGEEKRIKNSQIIFILKLCYLPVNNYRK
jgi:hypothetical protein